MNNIITIDPEEVLQNTTSNFFMVIWSSSQGTFFGTGSGGFQNALVGKMDSPAVSRNNAVEAYWDLVRTAKGHSEIKDGRIDLVAMPVFS